MTCSLECDLSDELGGQIRSELFEEIGLCLTTSSPLISEELFNSGLLLGLNREGFDELLDILHLIEELIGVALFGSIHGNSSEETKGDSEECVS